MYWLIKSTLLFLILSAFRPLTWLRVLATAGIVVSGLFYLSTSTIIGVACRPLGGTDRLAFFNGQMRPACTKYQFSTLTAIGAFNLISDIYILIIPLPAIAKLTLPLQQKFGVFLIFFTGSMYVQPEKS